MISDDLELSHQVILLAENLLKIEWEGTYEKTSIAS